MTTYEFGPVTHTNEDGWHQKAALKAEPVTREEYEGLFGAIVRLTDRIERLETWAWGSLGRPMTPQELAEFKEKYRKELAE